MCVLGAFTTIVELHGRRRHTHLVVACAKLQVALDVVGLACNLVFLYESDVVLEIAKLYAKDGIHLANLASNVLQPTNGFHTLGLICV